MLAIWTVIPNTPKLSTTIALNIPPIKATTLALLANYCTIVASPALHQAILVLVYLVVSLASMATRATFMAKESSTAVYWMTSE